MDTAFRFVSEGPVNVFCWMDGPFRYAITAAADRAALTQVSAEVYRQLEDAAALSGPARAGRVRRPAGPAR